MAKTPKKTHKTQTLSFPIRLPDQMQQEALRLLDASREAINASIVELWPQLDRFAGERSGPAWKQVAKYLIRRSGHGNRQERNEMEQAGRILRAQATRKQLFQIILAGPPHPGAREATSPQRPPGNP
jgi:putative transposase